MAKLNSNSPKHKYPNPCPICQNRKRIILKFIRDNFYIYFCFNCQNGFTAPVPKNLAAYYHDKYWASVGLVGLTKDFIYSFFQRRRKIWVEKYLTKGKILDVGSGEGLFSKYFTKNYTITNLDFPKSQIKNPLVLKKDFLNWGTGQKFDAVVFWESLEHVKNPTGYIKKTGALLNKGGFVFIECPNFTSTESAIFKNNWFHLDPPRHLFHYSIPGLKYILRKNRFKLVEIKYVLAWEYVILGFVENVLSYYSINITDSVKKGNILLLIAIIPLIPVAVILEIYFYLMQNTPIILVVAKKK